MASNPYPVAPPTPDPDALGFEPGQPMVKWFTPSELTRAGAETLISSLFGAYADNRELQAVRDDIEPVSYAGEGEIWIDYVADLGDGWDSTYSIASLLSAPTLEVDGVETQRGRLLILGGDQVYPTAKREEYQNRFAGPYRAALPYVRSEDTPPHLFALPGNHDWYDGLTSFTRLFCQGRWIGGWKTQQRRSYFAIELPGNWWIWGVDVQLNADIDQPQLRFFEELGARIPQGARIILCTAEPSWATAGADEHMADYDGLAWFEAQTMGRYGHRHVVGLAGDFHCYARWEHADGRQRFISGGGGAYLYPTHRFCHTLCLPTEPGPKPDRGTETFTLGAPDTEAGEALYPPAATSRSLAVRALAFPFLNRRFSLFFGAFYLFLAWLVQSASKSISDVDPFLEGLRGRTQFGEMVYDLLQVLVHAPLAFLTALVLFAGLMAFADGANWWWKVALGLAHTTAHLIAFLLLTWIFAELNIYVLENESVDSVFQTMLFAIEMLMIGSLVAGVIWGLYLYLSHLAGRHANEVFSCQGISDYKHFLRLHLDADGALTIYPIGIDHVPHDWAYHPGADGTPWYRPKGEPMAARAHLVEPPIRVPTTVGGLDAPRGDGATGAPRPASSATGA